MDTLTAVATFVLVSFVIGTLVWAGIAVFVVGRAVRRMLCRNRLVPFTRTSAPLWWLWSPRALARLHRRLCAALAPVAPLLPRAKREPGPLSELASDVLALAQTTDTALVEASGMPAPARRRAMATLARDVRTVEGLSTRLVAAACAWGSDPAVERGRRAAVLAERLDALDAARLELADLDPAARTEALGPATPDPLLAPRQARLRAGRIRRLVG